MSLTYERECKENEMGKCVLTSQRDTFRDFFIQGVCISSWPLTVELRAVLFGMFVKMYIRCGRRGGQFLKTMKDVNVTRF